MHQNGNQGEGGNSMSGNSGHLAERSGRMAMLFEDLAPAVLADKFAFQMERSPKREKWIARFSAQALLAGFYLQHLTDYDRMFKVVFQVDSDDYSRLPDAEIINVQQREAKNQYWLDVELAESFNRLGRRISTLQELEVLTKLLRDTQRRISRRQEDYTEFDAQISFFDEPMKFVLKINEVLGPFVYLSGEFEDEDFVAEGSFHIRTKPKAISANAISL
ncbi:hypothetical protein KAX06_01425 [candidate division WOR-3 bacterium]|nr:hypothetical protein [candidate division WOR-3 bacterium]